MTLIIKKVIFNLCSVAFLLIPNFVWAMDFNCNQPSTFAEEAICSDNHAKLRNELTEAYNNALKVAFVPDSLKLEQMYWLESIKNCKEKVCIEKGFNQRIKELLSYDENQQLNNRCKFPNLSTPDSYKVFAAGGSGRILDFQIDQSGREVQLIDVIVNSPSKPVIVLLGSYDPTIWNIKWTPATKIVAVVTSGFHRQVIAGLDSAIPTLAISADSNNSCGYFYIGRANDVKKLNSISRMLFGKSVDLIYPTKLNIVTIGDDVQSGAKLIFSKTTTPESFYNKNFPLAGTAGLDDAVKRGLIRRATNADINAWSKDQFENLQTNPQDIPKVVGNGSPKLFLPEEELAYGYVILKPFTYPAALYGGYATRFYLYKGVQKPNGDPGHSVVFDFNSHSCSGALCSSE